MSAPVVKVLAVIESAAIEMHAEGFIALPPKLKAAHRAIVELIAAAGPFAELNSSEETITIHVSTAHVTRLRAALANVGSAS